MKEKSQPSDVYLNTSLKIAINDHDIFTINGINFHRIKNHPVILAERSDVGTFKLPFNKTWGISIDQYKAVFPHEHHFADAYQNHFVSIFKWLKIVHNMKKDRTVEGPLPSDLLINVSMFQTGALLTQ